MSILLVLIAYHNNANILIQLIESEMVIIFLLMMLKSDAKKKKQLRIATELVFLLAEMLKWIETYDYDVVFFPILLESCKIAITKITPTKEWNKTLSKFSKRKRKVNWKKKKHSKESFHFLFEILKIFLKPFAKNSAQRIVAWYISSIICNFLKEKS